MSAACEIFIVWHTTRITNAESGLKAFQLLNFKKLTEAASGPAINRQVQRDCVDPPNFKHMCTFLLL